jgi:hypothetical protein
MTDDKDQNAIAKAIRYAAWTLGTGDAATTMGAIEALAMTQKEALSSLGDSISFALNDVAEALREVANAIEAHTAGRGGSIGESNSIDDNPAQ